MAWQETKFRDTLIAKNIIVNKTMLKFYSKLSKKNKTTFSDEVVKVLKEGMKKCLVSKED